MATGYCLLRCSKFCHVVS